MKQTPILYQWTTPSKNLSIITASINKNAEYKSCQHRIDTMAEHEAAMAVGLEDSSTKSPELETKLSTTKKNLESLSLHADPFRRPPPVTSPTNSLCSYSTALSRARNEIEGRRASRAAARARIDAALNELQSPKSQVEEHGPAIMEIQHSRDFLSDVNMSSLDEDEERRQPVELEGQVEESREDNKEDRILDENESRRSEEKVTKLESSADSEETKQTNCEGQKETKSKVSNSNESMISGQNVQNESVPAFVFTEASLLAVSQAALQVAEESVNGSDEKGEVRRKKSKNHVNTSGANSFVSSDPRSKVSTTWSKKASKRKTNSSRVLTDADMLAVSQAALDVSARAEFFSENKQSISEIQGYADFDDLNNVALTHSMSETSVEPYTQNEALQNELNMSVPSVREEQKKVVEESIQITSNASQNNSKVEIIEENEAPNELRQTNNLDKQDDKSHTSLSSTFSSWENVKHQNKVNKIDDEIGALDSIMFQRKNFGQLEQSKPPMLDIGFSEDSGHSSYSSEDSQEYSPKKEKGNIWWKTLNDSQNALNPTSGKKSIEVVLGVDETFEDDEIAVSSRPNPSFNRTRLQYVAVSGGVFLLMNALFLVLDLSSFAIRVFGLVGLMSSTFPLMVICMYLMSSKTQYSFWVWSIKMLFLGVVCQVCALVLFIVALPLSAGVWTAGIVSLTYLLGLTVEMNMNSPLVGQTGKGKSSQSMIEDMMKYFGLFEFSPVHESESRSKSKQSVSRKKKTSPLLDITLDEGSAQNERKERRSSVYMPPDDI